MKIRNSFVSNSSSSSFIVQATPDNLMDETKFCLSEEQIKILQDFGFKYCYSPNLLQAEADALETYKTIEEAEIRQKEEWIRRRERSPDFDYEPEFNFYLPHYMTYSVICNQDEIAEFLIKNNIPFNALCHYGSETWKWRSGWNYYKETKNPGINLGFSESATENYFKITSAWVLCQRIFYTFKWNWKSPKLLVLRLNGIAKQLIFNWAVTTRHPIEELK